MVVCGLIVYAVGVLTFFQSPVFSAFWIVSSQTALDAIYVAAAVAAALSITVLSIVLIKKQKSAHLVTSKEPVIKGHEVQLRANPTTYHKITYNPQSIKTDQENQSASKRTSIIVVALVIVGIILLLITFAALTLSPHGSSTDVVSKSSIVSSNGKVSTSASCGLFSNSACTTPISSINWGNLTAGETSNQTIYIKNISSGLSLTLNMTTNSWSPASANGPITITWNQEDTILSPGQSTAATLTISVSSSEVDITSFSVQILITGASS